jgi:hypothetical protein
MQALVGKLAMGVRLLMPFALMGFVAGIAAAQVTPNELSRLSLEELLGVEIEDITKDKRWFLGYEFRHLNVGKYQMGTTRLSFDDVQFTPGTEARTSSNYPIVPTYIKQSAHSFRVGRDITTELSLSVSVPIVMQSTDHISIVPGFDEFVIKSKDLGDISLAAQYRFHRAASSHAFVGFGVSLPTGTIDEVGDTPRAGTGTLERLPYTMQIGSGTYDFLLDFAFEQDVKNWALGVRADTIFRSGKNKFDYRLGNNYGLEFTARYKGFARVHPGLKVSFRTTERINGRDESLVIPGVPFPFGASITDPRNFGGEKIKVGGSLRLCLKDSCTLNILVRGGLPIYQNLNGIQPRERYSLSSAINYSF